MERANIVIIGGGVVGCAIALEVSRRWKDTFVLEQMPRPGMATSTRNSGVIHSGIYYDYGSLKARHCVEGNRLTYEFCDKHGVPYRRTGKLVVATNEAEERELQELLTRGNKNGVAGLRIVDRKRISVREPHVAGRAALEAPSTGIVSAEELVKAYARAAIEAGANILTHARVTGLEASDSGVRVRIEVGDPEDRERIEREEVEARCVINAAGLFADEVAVLLGNRDYRIYPVRGEYAEIARTRAHLINGLVYPLPHRDGLSLGVHLTKTLWGTVLVGPTARYIQEKNDYEHDRLPVEDFAYGAKLLLPEIEASDLALAYSGIRPKLVPPGGKGPADFVIARDPEVPQAIHLVGIESPGLTAAPSIARHVAAMAAQILR